MLSRLVALVLLIEYFRPQTFLPVLGALKITTLLPLGVIAMSLFAPGTAQRLTNGEVLAKRNSRWLLFFFFLLLVSLLTSDVTLYSYNVLNTAFSFSLLYFVVTKEITTIDALKGVFIALVSAHILLIGFNPAILTTPEVRSYLSHAYLGDGNDFALSVCIVLPLCLFLVQDSPKLWQRGLAIAALGLLLLSIVGTSSRGGTVALACVLFYQWLRSGRKILGMVVLAFAVAAIFVYAPPEYFQRMESITEYETEGSAQGRLSAWGAALQMAADHPLLGVGSGHFPVKYGAEYYPPDAERGPWLTAHSIYFLILGELGIPGIVFLVAVVFGSLWRVDRRIVRLKRDTAAQQRRRRRLLLAVNSAMIGYGAAGAFLSALYYPHLFVLLALYNAVEEVERREFSAESPTEDVESASQTPAPALAPRKYRRPDD
jgi:probable O-glycosylation ligase (exosortase A-associated)